MLSVIVPVYNEEENLEEFHRRLLEVCSLLKEEYEIIVNSGIELQLDCPDLALSRHMLFSDLSDQEFIKIATSHVDASAIMSSKVLMFYDLSFIFNVF